MAFTWTLKQADNDTDAGKVICANYKSENYYRDGDFLVPPRKGWFSIIAKRLLGCICKAFLFFAGVFSLQRQVR